MDYQLPDNKNLIRNDAPPPSRVTGHVCLLCAPRCSAQSLAEFVAGLRFLWSAGQQ